MIAMAPKGVSLHFHRMVAHGTPGSLVGQTERNRSMVENIDDSIELLAMVKPDVIVVAHTATSYHLGRRGEAELLDRLERATGRRVVTAFGSVVRALERLGMRKLGLGTPYSAEVTLQGKAHLEAHGFEVVRFDNLKGIENIYDTTAEHAYALARSVNTDDRRRGLSQRHWNADSDRIGVARTGSWQAGDFECVRNDVARAGPGRCRPAAHGLWAFADYQVMRRNQDDQGERIVSQQ